MSIFNDFTKLFNKGVTLASLEKISGITATQIIKSNPQFTAKAVRDSMLERAVKTPATDLMSLRRKPSAKAITDKLKSAASTKYNGKTLLEWNRCWECIGPLAFANTTRYNNVAGLYRMVLNGRTVYVGRATEAMNGGLRKRLNDYRRDNGSARKHKSGQLIYSHRNELTVYVLPVGSSAEAVEATKKLEGLFIAKYMPEWNKQINI